MNRIFLRAAAIWLLLNLLTLTGYPAVWVDEILSADAGIHLAQGKGFVSAAWFNQPSWEFWASYPPLYALALSGWLKVLGVSAFAVRSFGLLLITAALVMLWLVWKRIDESAPRWLIVAALAISEPLAFLERAGRPDSVSVFLLCATAWVFMAKTWRWRAPMLFVLGLLAAPAALQYAAYVLVLALLLHIWFQPFTRRDLTLWTAGAASGIAVLAGIYTSHHVLKIFLESTLASKHSSAGRLLQNVVLGRGERPFVLADIVTAPLRDWATPIVIAGGLLAWWFAKRVNDPHARRLSSFGIACGVLVPLVIQLLGKYPIYYAYMGLMPATMAIIAATERLGPKMRFAKWAIFVALLLGGAGRFWWKGWTQSPQDYFYLATPITNEDTVVADYPTYYRMIGHCRELFAVGYAGGKVMPHFPADQAGRVSKMLVRDSMFADVAKKVGGQWQRSGEALFIHGNSATPLATIDDDTRKPDKEPIGIYVRVPSP